MRTWARGIEYRSHRAYGSSPCNTSPRPRGEKKKRELELSKRSGRYDVTMVNGTSRVVTSIGNTSVLRG